MSFPLRNAIILSILLHAGIVLFFAGPPLTPSFEPKNFPITVYLRPAGNPATGSAKPAPRMEAGKTSSSKIRNSAGPSSSSLPEDKDGDTESLGLSSETSGTSLNPRNWSAEKNMDEVLKLSPFFQEVAARLIAQSDYKEELVRDDIEGSVLVYLEVNAKGILQRMTVSSADAPSPLRAMTLENVRKALASPLPRTAPVPFVQLTVRVDYSITHPRYPRPIVPLRIEGNEISISKQVVKAAKFDITEQSLDDNIFTRIFKKKKPSLRETWDLSQKTDRLMRACELERVDEVCNKAGENLVLLDRLSEATRLYESLCEDGKKAACDVVRNIKSNL